MEPQEIIAALEAPAEDRRPLMDRLREDEQPERLAAALAAAPTPFTRQLLADLLGFQAAPEGSAALTLALADADLKVRASAADALGKVFLAHPEAPGREDAGAALLARFGAEPETAVKHMLAAALGATRYEPAAPALQAAAKDPDPGLRDAAEWALSRLGTA
jgi:HEAT repeat protein